MACPLQGGPRTKNNQMGLKQHGIESNVFVWENSCYPCYHERYKKYFSISSWSILKHITLDTADFDICYRAQNLMHAADGPQRITSGQHPRRSWAETCNYRHGKCPPFGTHNTHNSRCIHTANSLLGVEQCVMCLCFGCVWCQHISVYFLCIIWCPFTEGDMHAMFYDCSILACLGHECPFSPLNRQSSAVLLSLWLESSTPNVTHIQTSSNTQALFFEPLWGTGGGDAVFAAVRGQQPFHLPSGLTFCRLSIIFVLYVCVVNTTIIV